MNNLIVENHDALKDLLSQQDKVVLFLGAGFSSGATNSNDKPIPYSAKMLSDSFKNELSSNGINNTADDYKTLASIYEGVFSNIKVEKFYNDLFTIKEYPDFFKFLTIIKWKAIYTLNYDNLVEKIYSDSNLADLIVSYSYKTGSNNNDNNYAPYPNGKIPVMHIHGSVPVTTEYLSGRFKKSIILTREDDGDNVLNNFWQRFLNDYLSNPVIIIGSSLSEELFDFNYGLVMQGLNAINPINPDRTGYIITPQEDNNSLQLFKKYHYLTHIQCKTEDFLHWIDRNFGDVGAGNVPNLRKNDNESIIFLNSAFWNNIKDNPKKSAELLNYYTSVNNDMLPWVIVQSWYFPPDENIKYLVSDEYKEENDVLGLKEAINKALVENRLSILQIIGPGGEGKSSLLYWLGSELYKEYNIIICRSLKNFNLPDFENPNPIIILIDEVSELYNSEHKNSFYSFISNSAKSIPILILTTDRGNNSRVKEANQNSDDIFQNKYYLQYKSDRKQIDLVLKKIYTSLTEPNSRNEEEFVNLASERRLTLFEKILTLLVQLDKGKKLKALFRFDWRQFNNQVVDERVKNLYFVVASFYKYNLKVPYTFSFANWLLPNSYILPEFSSVIAEKDRFSKPINKDERGLLTLRHQLLAKWYFEVNEDEKIRHGFFWDELIKHFKQDRLNSNDTIILRNLYTGSEDFSLSEFASKISINDVIHILENHLEQNDDWNDTELAKCVLDLVNLYQKENQDYSKCEKLLLRSINEKKCKHDRLYIKLGNIYLFWAVQMQNSNRSDEALSLFEKSENVFNSYLSREETEKEFALRGLRKISSIRVRNIEDRIIQAGNYPLRIYKLAKEAFKNEEYSDAEKCLEKLLVLEKLQPQFSTFLLGGKLYVELFNYEKAQDFFIKAVAINDHIEAPLLEIAMLHRKMCDENYSDEFTQESIIAEFKALYEKFGSDSIYVRTETAKTFISYNVNLDEAEDMLNMNLAVTSGNTNHLPSVFQLIILYQKSRDTVDKAIKMYDYAIANASPNEARILNIMKAKTLIKRKLPGDLGTAELILQECIYKGKNKVDNSPLLALIELYFIQRLSTASINTKIYKYILEYNIINSQFYLLSSRIYFEHSAYEEALHLINKGIKSIKDSDTQISQLNRLRYEKAMILIKAEFAEINRFDLAFDELCGLYLTQTERNSLWLYIGFINYYSKLDEQQSKSISRVARQCWNYAVLKIYSINPNNIFALGHLIYMLSKSLYRPRLAVFWADHKIAELKKKKYNLEFLYRGIASASAIFGDRQRYEEIRSMYPYRIGEFKNKSALNTINHSEKGRYNSSLHLIVLDKGRKARLEENFTMPDSLKEKQLLCKTYIKSDILFAHYFEEYFNPYEKRVEAIILKLYEEGKRHVEKFGWAKS